MSELISIIFTLYINFFMEKRTKDKIGPEDAFDSFLLVLIQYLSGWRVENKSENGNDAHSHHIISLIALITIIYTQITTHTL